MKIVRTDCELQTPCIDARLCAWGHELVRLKCGISEEAFCREMVDTGLLLTCYTPVTARVITAAPKLRGIVKYGVGIDTIDIPAARSRGIVVVNIPAYAEETVAEGAFALLIALAKKLTRLHMHMRDTGWAWPTANWLGTDLAGKTLGIVGAGRIGRHMARMAAQGFRIRVLAYDPYKSRDELAAAGIEKHDHLKEMLKACDFVSLHAVLNNQTRHLIGASELAAMKPGSILINTARGALVDEQALLQALLQQHLAGAGLDVFGQEPLTRFDHPLSTLFEMDNVILLPHLTFFTTEAMQRLEAETLDRCLEIIENRPVKIISQDPRLAVHT